MDVIIETKETHIRVNVKKELIEVNTIESINSRFYKKIIELIKLDRRVNPIDVYDYEIKTNKI